MSTGDLASEVAALSPARRELLQRTLREKAAPEPESIPRRICAAKSPLSFGQRRFWFLDQWEPGNPAYNMSLAVRIEGALDPAVVDQSLTEIARRHEVLRTTFAAADEGPVQIVHPGRHVTARRLDLSAVPRAQQDADASNAMTMEATRPFDLVTGPLWRALLLQLDPRTHLLVFSVHHSVFDGLSMGVLYREFFALYEAFANGRVSPLRELPIQYADFAVWQRERLQGDLLANQLGYWRQQLHDLSVLDIPTDHPRPALQTFAGASHLIHLPAGLVDALKSLSRAQGATLFMTLLAAFQTLLHRYSGQADIVVGTPIAGRTGAELKEAIGFFVNVLALRTDASGDPAFHEFLDRVKCVALDAYAHQDIPFEKLVEELHPVRDPSRNPLFQIVFALQNSPEPLTLSDLSVTRIPLPKAYTRFDLEVHLQEHDDGLNGLFVYNVALFEAETIARLAERFRLVLDAIVADPERQLSEISLLTERERQQVVVDWNQTATSYPRDAAVHALFEAQVRAVPDALAVAFGERRLTYRELNERANRLAHHLRSLGVGPDVLVGVLSERSIEMIVGFLAILKAGGAYVPLDPSFPRERIAFMLDDANVPVVLTQETLRSMLPPGHARIVDLDQRFTREGPHNLESEATASSLAYVMYTSGSTGMPKGVAVRHRAVVRLVVNTNYVQLGPADRVAQVSNVSFDAATFEIWGALLNGGSVIGIPQTVLLSPRDFARALREERISTLFLTTALFNQMASDVPSAFGSLRYLLFGGEVCHPKWVRAVLTHGSPQSLVHVYGPTEGTTFTTWHRVETVDAAATTVPIGRPVSNTRVYLLDRHLQPVPIGISGELCIGGDGVARDYVNRVELTAGKFIRDPFDADPASRLYRTGDFARYQPNGSIQFLGRIDGQVKIRGFRIELQEIEAALLQHPGVSQSLVVVRERDDGDKRLIAYFTPAAGARPASDALRGFVAEKLPQHMVPSAFVKLDALPVTPNGKVDHAALPTPGHDRDEHRPPFAPPRTTLERALAEIWEGLLGVERIGIDDNFFDLGGHSLLAIELITRIERRLARTVPAAALFQSPTIGGLARLLGERRQPKSWSSLIPVQSGGAERPFFWVHGDSSNVRLPEYLGPDRPLYALEHQAHDGRPAQFTRVETIAAHYLAEIRAASPRGPYLLGGFSFGATVAFEMAQQLRTAGEEVALLFLLDPPGQRANDARSTRQRLHDWLRGARQMHLKDLLRLPGAALGWRIAGVQGKIVNNLNRLRLKVSLSRERRLAPSLRRVHVQGIYRQALQSYVPRPYAGRVTIFKRDEGSYLPPYAWQDLIMGEVEVYEAPISHMDATKDPHVGVWARRLKASLDKCGAAEGTEDGARVPARR